jgi:hypothetical protein
MPLLTGKPNSQQPFHIGAEVCMEPLPKVTYAKYKKAYNTSLEVSLKKQDSTIFNFIRIDLRQRQEAPKMPSPFDDWKM